MRAFLALITCALLAGCSGDPTLGYSAASTYAADVRTVAVPVFDNETFDYHTEVLLTEAIIKEIQQTTPWRVVSPGSADTTLTGVISESQIRSTASKRGIGYAQEQAVELTVDFEWKDNRTGQPLVARQNFSAAEVFAASRPVQERVEVGKHAAIQELARDIVNELRSNW